MERSRNDSIILETRPEEAGRGREGSGRVQRRNGKYSEVGRGRQEAWRKSRKEIDGWMW